MAEHKKILITGVAGFIGSNLAARLIRENCEVVGLENLSYGLERQIPEGVKWHRADIRSKDIYPLFKGIDIVFHLAAKNTLADCQKDPVETMDINVVGTANVFEAAKRAGVKKVIYADSSAVEEGDGRTKGFYAISKIADAKIADGFQAAYGLHTVGARYFNVYGPGQDYRRTSPPVMSALIIKVLKGERPTLVEGSEKNKRDFVYIDDVNDFHVLCLEDERALNRTFRIASGKSTSILEVWQTIKKLMKTDIEPIIVPREPEDVAVEPSADISETLKLGWKPKMSLEEGLTKMIEWLKDEFEKGKIR